jgi:hypothetical protein
MPSKSLVDSSNLGKIGERTAVLGINFLIQELFFELSPWFFIPSIPKPKYLRQSHLYSTRRYQVYSEN